MRTLSGIFVLSIVAALVGAGCGENPAPDRPTYARDVEPLMTAHCIRCHGAGGTLNKDPDAQPIGTGMAQQPTNGDFTQLGPDAAGKNGLMTYTGPGAVIMLQYLSTMAGPMPPPPAPPLTDREYTILTTWIHNPLP